MRRQILLALGSTLLAIVAVEVVLRWLAPPARPGVATIHAPNASFAGWALPPNAWLSVANPDSGRPTNFRTNSRGWKDRERDLAKPEGTFRIVALGDSYTFGVVPIEQQYTTQLEAILQERGWPHCEVISLGVSGWGTDQSLETLIHEGLRYQPDLVLYQFCSNDLLENLYPTPDLPLPTPFHRVKGFHYVVQEDGRLVRQEIPIEPKPLSLGKRFRRALGPMALVSLFDRALSSQQRAKALDGSSTELSPAIDPESPYFIYSTSEDPPGAQRAWELLDALVRRMRDEAYRQGAEFVVFSESGDSGRRHWFLDQGLVRASPEGDERVQDGSVYPIDLKRPLTNLAQICEEADIPLIRPARFYTRYRHDSHANAEGNARMAADIADFLSQHPRLADQANLSEDRRRR